jgi:hypothetical protein
VAAVCKSEGVSTPFAGRRLHEAATFARISSASKVNCGTAELDDIERENRG